MSFVISSASPFPDLAWWAGILNMETIRWDLSEAFEKMTSRNRYFVCGANGLIRLSIPIRFGRDHHALMNDILISYDQDWQKQHWRTLVSAYNRSPFFPYYANTLESIYRTRFESLVDFNLASVHWVKNQLKLAIKEEQEFHFQKPYPGATLDLRRGKSPSGCSALSFPEYYQVFQDRNGFFPNLSILDLLFSEGPSAATWLIRNKDVLKKWNGL